MDGQLVLRLFAEISRETPSEQERRLAEIENEAVRSAVRRRLREFSELSSVRSLEDDFGYQIGEVIGQGGYGTVYRAKQKAINRVVAFKVFTDTKLRSNRATEQMRQAAESAAKLNHPGIVQIIEPGIRDGKFYLVTEYIDGETLAEYLQESGPIDAKTAANLALKIADAVAHAHSRQIIHRDLKPANILLDKAGEPKVSDFDLIHDFTTEKGKQALPFAGTPSYMSPEQARSESLGPQTDVYSLGTILYEALTGRPPHQAASPEETLQDVCDSDIVSPRSLNSHVPHDLEVICLKCLQKSPQLRYSDASELHKELRRYVNGEPIHARPVSVFERTLKWARRSPTMATLAASLLIAVVAAFGGISWQAWRAEKARRASDANLVTALDTIDYFNREIVNTDLANAPGMAPLRKKILQKNAQFFESLLHNNERSSVVLSGGTVYLSLGDISHALGDLGLAENAYRDAISLYESDPGQTSREAVLRAWNSLANLKSDLGQDEEWEQLLQEFDNFLTKYRSDDAKSEKDIESLAALRLNQARLYTKKGELERAEVACREALAAHEQLAAPEPRKVHAVSSLASAWFNLGNILLRMDERDDADSAFQNGLSLQHELVEAHPDDYSFRGKLATSYRTMARLCKFQQRTDDAVEHYQKAHDELDKLILSQPSMPGFRHELAETLVGVSALIEAKLAIPLLEKAVESQRMACKLSPDNSRFSFTLRNHLNRLATVYAESGDHRKAFPVAQEFITRADRSADFVFGAFLLFECVILAEKDDTIPSSERNILSNRYQTECSNSLDTALDRGLLSADTLSDPLFESVRDNNRFKTIVNEVLNRTVVAD